MWDLIMSYGNKVRSNSKMRVHTTSSLVNDHSEDVINYQYVFFLLKSRDDTRRVAKRWVETCSKAWEVGSMVKY